MSQPVNPQLFLIINAGSSSLKFQLFQKQLSSPTGYQLRGRGLYERIGDTDHSQLRFEAADGAVNTTVFAINNHAAAVNHLLGFLKQQHLVTDLNELVGIGHRLVNCGARLTTSCRITAQVLTEMQQNMAFAPLHNPAALQTIMTFQQHTRVSAVAVFDTSFHQTIPLVNYLYPVPYDWYVKYGVRRYGMHGTNYRYVLQRLAQLWNKPPSTINIIVCHLGNGASVCAIKNGRSVMTSMGLTPLEGLMMGTRSGDIDPAIGQYLQTKTNLNLDQFVTALNHRAGLLGVSGVSADMRTVKAQADAGHQRSRLAIQMFISRVCKYISWYQNEVGVPLDGLVFTGGIGENAAWIRQAIAQKIVTLKLRLAPQVAASSLPDVALISQADSATPVYVVRANEELIMCQDVDRLCRHD